MQDRPNDRIGVEVQLGEDLGGCDGMGDVGLAREALLSLVGKSAELGGLADAFHLVRGQVELDLGEQLLQTRSAPCAGAG